MKFTQVSFFLCLWTCICLRADAQAIFTNQLVSHFTFSGTTEDESGNGLNGVPLNVRFATDRFGNPGAACQFNGVDSRVTVMPSPLLKLTNTLTASFWLKGDPSGKMLLCKGISDLSYSIGCDLERKLGLNKQGIVTIVKTATPVPQNSWLQVVVTLDSNSARIFFNGSLVATAPATPVNSGDEPLSIGSVYGGGQNYGGLIDDVRLYSRSLTPQEVSQLYAYESVPQPCFPRRARASAVVNGGLVTALPIVFSGCGYTNHPTVTIEGGEGIGAAGVAEVQDGRITSVTLTASGSGYTSVPIVRIAPPPFAPRLSVYLSKVRVVLEVSTGFRYQIQQSDDLLTWVNAGSPITAESDIIVRELDAETSGRHFRIQQIP